MLKSSKRRRAGVPAALLIFTSLLPGPAVSEAIKRPRTVYQLGTNYTTSPGVFTPFIWHGVFPTMQACLRQSEIEVRKLSKKLKDRYRTGSTCNPVIQYPIDQSTIEPDDECDGC